MAKKNDTDKVGIRMAAEGTRLLTVIAVARENNTVHGNPMYRFEFSDGTAARTQRDAAFAFGIVEGVLRGAEVEASFDEKGYLSGIRKRGEANL